MKKLALIFMIILSASVIFAGCGEPEKQVVIEYGESYTVPFYEDSSYTLKNSKGELVNLENYTFFVDDFDGYTLNIKGEKSVNIKYNVVDTTAPVITSEYAFKNVYAINQKISLPTITVKDKADFSPQISYSVKSDSDGEELAVAQGGFTPTAFGQYTLTVSATDESGNTAKKEVYYNLLEKEDKLTSVVANFSGKNGVNHVANERGMTTFYDTTVKYGNEYGSTALHINGDNWFQASFQLNSPAKYDLSQTKGFGFRVFNSLNSDVLLGVNWCWIFSLPQGEWAEVFIPYSEYGKMSEVDAPMFAGKSSIKDITGLFFAFYNQGGSGLSVGNLYISDMYSIDYSGVNTLIDYSEELAQTTISEDNLMQFKSFFKAYETLTEVDKGTISGYDVVMNNYIAYMVNKYHAENYQNTYISFSSELYKEQVSIENASSRINANRPITDGTYTQTNTLELTSASAWSITIRPDFFLTVENFDKIYFYVWAEDYSTFTSDYKFYIQYVNDPMGVAELDIELTPNAWTKVEIDLGGKPFGGGVLDIYCSENNGKPWYSMMPTGVEFRISDIIGVNK